MRKPSPPRSRERNHTLQQNSSYQLTYLPSRVPFLFLAHSSCISHLSQTGLLKLTAKSPPTIPQICSSRHPERLSRAFFCREGKRGRGRKTRLDLEAARASPTASSFEFPAFALDVRFLISPSRCQLRVLSNCNHFSVSSHSQMPIAMLLSRIFPNSNANNGIRNMRRYGPENPTFPL